MLARWGGPATLLGVSPFYENPPVVETSLVVQFSPQTSWTIDILGSFRDAIRERFPHFESTAPIALRQSPPFQFLVGTSPRARGLYINRDAGNLLQLQDDFFAMNWRKPTADAPYPRYQALRRNFIQEFERFLDFLETRELARPAIAGCQVTYVNIIESDSGLDHQDVWSFGEGKNSPNDRLAPASVTIAALFRNDTENLTYNVAPALRVQDNRTVMQVTLTSSAEKVDEAGADLLPRLDAAHDLLIRAFEELTSKKAKTVWGRKK